MKPWSEIYQSGQVCLHKVSVSDRYHRYQPEFDSVSYRKGKRWYRTSLLERLSSPCLPFRKGQAVVTKDGHNQQRRAATGSTKTEPSGGSFNHCLKYWGNLCLFFTLVHLLTYTYMTHKTNMHLLTHMYKYILYTDCTQTNSLCCSYRDASSNTAHIYRLKNIIQSTICKCMHPHFVQMENENCFWNVY